MKCRLDFVLAAVMGMMAAVALGAETIPMPSRNEAVAGFVSWATQNPQQMGAPPVEGIFRDLAQRYPCRALTSAF